jgi:hypothetical protein
MRLSRLARLRTIAMVLCALLLAQWSLAAHACPQLWVADSAPVSASEQHHAAGCTDASDAPSTLCYKHCNTDEQASGGGAMAFAAPPPALVMARATDEVRVESPASRPGLAHATAPPFTILYCVSLT